MRSDTKSSHPVLINNPVLPYIKASKTFLEETMKSSSHIMKGRPRDAFGEMLASEQHINKSSVFNVLRVSRVEKEESRH